MLKAQITKVVAAGEMTTIQNRPMTIRQAQVFQRGSLSKAIPSLMPLPEEQWGVT
jgi:hypothetical protein